MSDENMILVFEAVRDPNAGTFIVRTDQPVAMQREVAVAIHAQLTERWKRGASEEVRRNDPLEKFIITGDDREGFFIQVNQTFEHVQMANLYATMLTNICRGPDTGTQAYSRFTT